MQRRMSEAPETAGHGSYWLLPNLAFRTEPAQAPLVLVEALI